MMGWLPIILLAMAALAIAIFALRIGRGSWTLFAAVLTFGLAGYALQGSPQLNSAPKAAQPSAQQSGDAIVEARRSLFDTTLPPPAYLTISDGFARGGQFGRAARLLRRGLEENPNHGEGWMALGNALVEHADGRVTPAALLAYQRAEASLPGHPGPAYFMGAALLRSGQVVQARDIWADLLAISPEDAPWRDDLSGRIERLDLLIEQLSSAP